MSVVDSGSSRVIKMRRRSGRARRQVGPFGEVEESVIKRELAKLLRKGCVAAVKPTDRYGGNYSITCNNGKVYFLNIRLSTSNRTSAKRSSRSPLIKVEVRPSTKAVRRGLKSAMPSLRCARSAP
ncbi:MAG: hypothetical protein M1153_01295 [Patescibacteria group bacterium]|nr:hypothetical protein [Patescibacteria group bacterium]